MKQKHLRPLNDYVDSQPIDLARLPHYFFIEFRALAYTKQP